MAVSFTLGIGAPFLMIALIMWIVLVAWPAPEPQGQWDLAGGLVQVAKFAFGTFVTLLLAIVYLVLKLWGF